MQDEFTTVTDQPAAEYISIENSVQHILIVIPREYQKDGFITEFQPDGTDTVFCDIADLSAIDEATGQPGKVYQHQSILQGYLKGTFKRYLGHKLIGQIYYGPREKGRKPPYMWQDLSGEQDIRAQGLAWLAAHPEFVAGADFSGSTPEPSGPPRPIPAATPAVAGPYSQPDPHAVAKPLSTLEQMRAMNRGGAASGPPF